MSSVTRILIVGDSQVEQALKTYGFGSILNDKFNGEADIIVRKFPGYTSEWIKLLASSVSRNLGQSPDYVLLFVGRDDCLRSNSDKRPVTDPADYRRNLLSIINKITNEVDVRDDRIIIMAPAPVHDMKFQCYDQNNFAGMKADKWTMRTYVERAREVAKKVGGKFVDTPAILDRDLDNNISKNGYKLSEDGHLALAEALAQLIELTDSPFPHFEKVGSDYEKELVAIAKSHSIIVQENLSAYTSVSMVDQYNAMFKKTYRGKI